MNEFLCHLGRVFSLDGYLDHVQAISKTMPRRKREVSISDTNLNPVTDPAELAYLSGLVQFYRIPNKLLFKVVRVATGHRVSDRWVAIRVILTRSIPIPVPKPLEEVRQA